MSVFDSTLQSVFPSVFVDGRRRPDAVTLRINNEVYQAWDSITIQRALESMCGSFSIAMADKWRDSGEAWPLVPGAEVLIQIGKENALTGYIDKVAASVKSDTRTITVNGRDRTADLVDSSAFANPSVFKNLDIEQLAKKFATQIFGIPVVVDADLGNKFIKFPVKQGETVFEMLERAAKLRGLLLLTDEKGQLVITNRSGGDIGAAPELSGKAPSVKNLVAAATFAPPAITKSAVSFVQGENVLEAQATYDDSDRYQTYFVKGQSSGDDLFFGKSVTAVEAFARDLRIKRARIKILIADGNVDKTAAQKRANWEAIVRATKALNVTLKVQGWQKPDGTLYKLNELARVDCKYIGIDADLLITGLAFSKTSAGKTLTTVKLSRPDSYDPSKSELTEDSDPAKELGWKGQGIPEAYNAIRGLFG